MSEDGAAFLRVVREGRSFSGRERHCLFLNNGAGQFSDVSAVTGFDWDDDGRALCQVDWDDDGDLDLWLSNRNGPQVRFLENRTTNKSPDLQFVKVKLQGTKSNRDAIGARVRLFTKENPDQPVTRTMRAGDSFLSQSSKHLHFGLGKNVTIDRIEVRWPAGSTQVVQSPKVGQTCLIVEGDDKSTYRSTAVRLIKKSKFSPPIDETTERAISFSMIAFPSATYKDSSGFDQVFIRPTSQRVLVNLWAGWCAPCVEELKAFSEQAGKLNEQGIEIVALSTGALGGNESEVDESELLTQMGFPFRSGVADDALVTKLQMLNDILFEVRQPLPVPTSFMLDRKRRVLAVYKGPISVDSVIADTTLTRSAKTTAEWRDATVPFSGHWIQTPKRRHLFQFVEHLTDLGFLDEAREYVLRDEKIFLSDPRWPALHQRLLKRPR
ncbi:MAG: ASPIC/UnbV domain-containing protein [Planctomycetales bacterium]|nr:ASPIC/UnbV domain-containing protein [Planctomycetales bacterium]